ncbi:MAG: iron chelate uptake ABC transporter family permease subunit [Culicoidibacterales bacterium]
MTNKVKITIIIMISILMCLAYLFLNLDADTWRYVLSKRIPKLIAIILTGGAIAVATLMFQTITNNRVLTPSILGLDAIYQFIQTLIIFISTMIGVTIINSNVNFILSLGAMLIFSLAIYQFMFKKQQNIYLLLLMGVVLGTFFRSFSTFLQMIMDPNEFLRLQNSMFASFNNIQSQLLLVAIIIFLLLIPFIYDYIQNLDVLMLGKDTAINLGLDYEKMTKRIFIIVSLLIAVATALVGPITFLGLIIVNLAYELIKTYKHSVLLIVTISLSVIALVGGQLLTERIFNFKITISVIINFVGGIYFVYLLLKEKSI